MRCGIFLNKMVKYTHKKRRGVDYEAMVIIYFDYCGGFCSTAAGSQCTAGRETDCTDGWTKINKTGAASFRHHERSFVLFPKATSVIVKNIVIFNLFGSLSHTLQHLIPG